MDEYDQFAPQMPEAQEAVQNAFAQAQQNFPPQPDFAQPNYQPDFPPQPEIPQPSFQAQPDMNVPSFQTEVPQPSFDPQPAFQPEPPQPSFNPQPNFAPEYAQPSFQQDMNRQGVQQPNVAAYAPQSFAPAVKAEPKKIERTGLGVASFVLSLLSAAMVAIQIVSAPEIFGELEEFYSVISIPMLMQMAVAMPIAALALALSIRCLAKRNCRKVLAIFALVICILTIAAALFFSIRCTELV